MKLVRRKDEINNQPGMTISKKKPFPGITWPWRCDVNSIFQRSHGQILQSISEREDPIVMHFTDLYFKI